ncbi:kelch-like protein 8 [Argiope bruennichi]|uniref:kelch-like protein 8 n=1 Tax=Argiope bruennichi TaxID=94029 RepID=UPI002494AD75|nr:kelch-like protein 8 [Argiope bruennichi]XP_055930087.1 kelch-like protein 8 [Argiope bruennichi]XP_055930088.1 kelch-like protein 8 [Argiope bruennichi]XP_055930089.1 kelch-like protein 8 [Argiope bruennichi]
MGDILIESKETTEIPRVLQTSFNKLFEFLQNEILCDVVIQVQSKSFKCHRNVLASCSPYFQAMFTSPLAESKQSVITIKDIDEVTMEMLIKFAYTGKVNINGSNAQKLLKASSVLQFDYLAEACCDYISSCFDECTVCRIRETAESFGQSSLVKRADSFIKYNFNKVVPDNDFVYISDKHLEELLSADDLFVNDEVEVYEALMLWVKLDPDKRKNLLSKLLPKVRLPLMPLAYLRMYVESDSLVRKNLDCRDLLDEAKHYQMWQVSHLPTSHLPVTERTQPRKSYAGVIFCVGGRGVNGNPFSSIEFYSWYHNKWIKLKDMLTSRRHVGCVSEKGKIYAVGGFANDAHLSSAEQFDPETNKWSALAPMTVPRRGLGLCSMGGPLYAVGGLDNSLFYSIVERYDINADVWSVVASMNCSRGGVAVVNLKGHMYALGGNSGTISLQTCEVYDPHLDKWTFISPMNQSRAGAGAVVVDGFIYVIGGFENNVPLNSVEKYDPDSNKWSFVSSMQVARGGVGAAALGRYIYSIGGHNASCYLNTVEIYDVQNDRWSYGPVISDSRAGAGIAWCSMKPELLKKLAEGC